MSKWMTPARRAVFDAKAEKAAKEFFEKASVKHAGKYDYSKSVYPSKTLDGKSPSQQLIEIGCPTHGIFRQRPADHLRYGCYICSGGSKLSFEEWKLKARLKHGDRYEYLSLKGTKLSIVCSIHGPFEQLAVEHCRGQNCPRCSLDAKRGVALLQEEFVERLQKRHLGKYDYSKTVYTGCREEIIVTCPEHGDFVTNAFNHSQGSGVCPHCSKRSSKHQTQVADYLRKLHQIVELNCKPLENSNVEVDIYLPEHRLAIEINGEYWHSEQYRRGRTYHIDKQKALENQGIRTLQFWGSEVDVKKPVIGSMLRSRLGLLKNSVGARKCVVVTPTLEETKDFLDKNHLQGNVPYHKSFGLKFENVLVAVLTTGRPRFNDSVDWEILRFAVNRNFAVQGGFSKLLKATRAVLTGSYITYADRRYSVGNVYRQSGFQFSRMTPPSYFYVKGGVAISRYRTQKHKLPKLLGELFDSSKSEKENMTTAGYYRVWDCGQSVWTKS